ncbi:MAG: hypothetical protein MZU97_12540 [Bacillus subtilis]|nr:hypothetical protein [Bacillus subtilis]
MGELTRGALGGPLGLRLRDPPLHPGLGRHGRRRLPGGLRRVRPDHQFPGGGGPAVRGPVGARRPSPGSSASSPPISGAWPGPRAWPTSG